MKFRNKTCFSRILWVKYVFYKTNPQVHKKHDTSSHTFEILCLSLHQTYQYGRISHHIKCQLLAQSGFRTDSIRLFGRKLLQSPTHNGDEYTFSFNLVVFEKKIVEQLAQTAHFFARVGRNYIINSQHIFCINLNTSELVLYNERFCEKFTLHVSKEPLKQLKALLDNSIKS